MLVCVSCGHENRLGAKFCEECAAPLAIGAIQREQRKTVTVVFCDVTGSTALGESTDPEALRTLLARYFGRMKGIVESHGGSVEKFIGDAVMAVFGVPAAHEDDALRACRAAVEMRTAFPELGINGRIGVNTGEVVTGTEERLATGDAVNVAARLEQAAQPDEVLIGVETLRLVRSAVEVGDERALELKGKAGAVAAWPLLAVTGELERRFATPLVGRERELTRLHVVFDQAVHDRSCQLFTILGSAGVGKSRLVAEFVGSGYARVVRGRCLSYGEGITYWPVVEILKQLETLPEGDAARPLRSLLAETDEPASADEIAWGFRKLLEQEADSAPLICVLDDLHWAEETLLDLVEHVADLSRDAPLLLLCMARPELLELRSSWGGGKWNATTVLLEPLDAADTEQLIGELGGVADELREQIVQAAEGNPLFLEEMLALVRDSGGEVEVPPTIQALLAARLDQLEAGERSVLERGSVEGRTFHRGAVAALADGDGSIDQRLVSLVRKELVRPDRPQLQGDDAYRFRHLLIRDAAYDALPKATRAELHARFADWLEHHGLQLIELDEVLGYHLEQAARYRRELGRPDAELEQRAAVRLGEAGSRAARRSDAHGAANLLQRAIALLAPDDPRRTQLLVALIGTLEGVAQPEEQFRWIDELEASADPAARMHGRIARLQLRLMADPVEVLQQAETASEEALAVFAEVGDELGLAHTHYLVAWINWLQSRALPTAAAYDKVLEHARQAGAYTLLGQATVQQIGPLFHGPFTLEHVRSRLQRLEQDDSVDAHVAALFVGAELAERDGRFEDAHTLLDQANALNRELGQELGLAIGAQKHAEIFRSAGRLDDAAAAYREALARLEALGQTSFRSTTLINLGETLYLLGDRIGAERLAVEGEELGAAEDVVNFAFGRSLRARIAADRDDHQRGEQLAHEALQYAYKTDFPSVHAGAHEALAHVLAAAGRTDDARAELERALELWGTWCHQPNEQRVRELLREL